MIKNSLTLRVLIISFLLLALPLLIDSFIFFQYNYNEAIDLAEKRIEEGANFEKMGLSQVLPEKTILIKELIYLLDLDQKLEQPDPTQLNQLLLEITHKIGPSSQIFILSMENTIIASTATKPHETYFVDDLILKELVEKGGGAYLRYVYLPRMGRYYPYICIVQVIRSKKTGKPLGSIFLTASIQSAFYSGETQPDEDIHFAFLNPDGIVFLASDAALEGKYFQPLSLQKRREIFQSGRLGNIDLAPNPLPVVSKKNPPFFEFVFEKQVQIAFRSEMVDNVISVLGYSPKSLLFRRALHHFLLVYAIYGAILILGGGVTYWLSLWISKPLRQLSLLMREVGKGNLDVRFHEGPLGFEINILGKIFNHTLDTLLRNIQQAEDERVKKETYLREVAIGRVVQQSLLPSDMPTVQGAEIAGIYLAAREVGGDYFGYFTQKIKTGEEVLVLDIADAAGHGISTCLYSLSVRSLCRSYATLYEDVGEILYKANHDFADAIGDTQASVAVMMGMYYTASRKFDYYSCGPIMGLVRRRRDQLIPLEYNPLSLGLEEPTSYSTHSIQLEEGDLVVLYTDRWIEAFNQEGEPFSQQRFNQILETTEGEKPQQIVDYLCAQRRTFLEDRPQEEEAIIVVLKIY